MRDPYPASYGGRREERTKTVSYTHLDVYKRQVGSLEDNGRMKTVRRNIARIYTIARERELGYRTAPGTEE